MKSISEIIKLNATSINPSYKKGTKNVLKKSLKESSSDLSLLMSVWMKCVDVLVTRQLNSKLGT